MIQEIAMDTYIIDYWSTIVILKTVPAASRICKWIFKATLIIFLSQIQNVNKTDMFLVFPMLRFRQNVNISFYSFHCVNYEKRIMNNKRNQSAITRKDPLSGLILTSSDTTHCYVVFYQMTTQKIDLFFNHLALYISVCEHWGNQYQHTFTYSYIPNIVLK